MEQTAVEWLLEELLNRDWYQLPKSIKNEIIEQAKELEKRQRIDLLTKYHDRMFYIPFKEGEAESIYNFLNTVEK
jgi:hypothetical protein